MTDTFDGLDRKQKKRAVAMDMLKGAAIGGGIFFGPILFIVALYYIGLLLPPESKEAVDPTPDSFVNRFED